MKPPLSPTRRLPVLAAAAVSLLTLTAGCGTDDGTTSTTGEQTQSTPTPPSTDPTGPSSQSADPVDLTAYPAPPGATGWPVKDLETCEDLGTVTEPELLVRVPIATPECVTYENDVLVVAAKEMRLSIGAEPAIDLPGFDGTVRSVREPLSRGSAYVAHPTGSDVKYLVLWDGGTDLSIDRILAQLFVT